MTRRSAIVIKGLLEAREQAKPFRTPEEVAAILDVDERTVRRWEEGKSVKLRYIAKLEELYGVPLMDKKRPGMPVEAGQGSVREIDAHAKAAESHRTHITQARVTPQEKQRARKALKLSLRNMVEAGADDDELLDYAIDAVAELVLRGATPVPPARVAKPETVAKQAKHRKRQ